MKISEQINEDIKDAMRAKDKVALEALRAAKSAFLLAKTQAGATGDLTDEEELKVIQKLVKQRNDSAAIYREQSRSDLYDKEISEAAVLEKYLPAQMDESELRAYIKALVLKVGADGMKDMGKVMGMATGELAGKADGKTISMIVKEILTT